MGISQFEETLTDSYAARFPTDAGASFGSISTDIAYARRVDQIIVVSNDPLPIPISLSVSLANSATAFLGTVIIPALAGSDGTTPPVDLLPTIIPTLTNILLDRTDTVQIDFPASASVGNYLWVYTLAGRF